MIIEILFIFTLIIFLYSIINVYNLIEKMYIFKNKLINNNSIIIFNKPDRNHIFKLTLLIFEHICYDNIFDIDSHDDIIKKIKNNKINNIILDTTGGSILSNDILINFILTSKIKLNIYVPRKAQSAGTLLALSANILYVDKDAYLSPTDPQITFENETYSIKSFIELCDTKDINYITDKYLLCYYENKKLYDENITLFTKLLENKFKKNIKDKEKTSFILELTSGTWSHHKPISGTNLSKFLNVNICLPQNILNIYNIFDDIKNFI